MQHLSKADAALARFEARNVEVIKAEVEERLGERTICFTRVEVLRGFLQLALARTVVFTRVPLPDRDAIRADFTMKGERLVPAVSFTRDVELPVEVKFFASVMGRFFKDIAAEWGFELDHAQEDEVAFQQLAEWCANHPETSAAFAKRLKKWCA